MLIHKPVEVGDSVLTEAVLHIYNGLKKRTLPKSEWTHGAHLCAGTAILKDRGLEQAKLDMPPIIRAYNVATGGVNTDKEGYHHTITLFYLFEIDRYLRDWWDFDLGVLATRVLKSELADKTYPLRFYSKERLFSVEARKKWVEGDLPRPILQE